MSKTPAEGSKPLEDPYDFSLVLGGPLYQLVARARLSGGALELLARRVIVISLFVWLPLLILSILGGRAWGDAVRVPFLVDIEAHARFLLDTELGAFLSALKPPSAEGLLMMHPYRPGRVPVVLVHGTASSPARWADIINELQNDPKLRGRIQFWLFTYNTSNPVLLSASDLRQGLQRIRREIDPDGRDPALDQLVVIGHSQGGLLTRLMVTDSGTRFWDYVTDVPLEKIDVSPETRALIQRTMFFEAQPYVKRVVFIATPHRGSFRVSSFVLGMVRRLVTLPLTLVGGFAELAKNPGIPKEAATTAVDNMLPGHRFVRTLSASPIAPWVTAHSIIPVTNAGAALGQDDGVVRYESAHIEGVASEKIVRSTHSTQSTPATILEVRRILYEHLGIACGLECEVPDRVEAAAAAAAPKPEPAAVDPEEIQDP